MPILRDRNDLDKKPIWFLFLFANVIVVLGCAITWILIAREVDIKYIWLPTLICNLVAIVGAGFFIWIEAKDIGPKIMHYQKKWLKFYIAAMACFVAAILFNTMYYIGFLRERTVLIIKNKSAWELAIYLAITGVLTLAAIGLQRYARFRIDLDVYRRKHGEEIKDKEAKKAEEAKQETKPEQPVVEQPTSDIQQPTGGLIDQMDK